MGKVEKPNNLEKILQNNKIFFFAFIYRISQDTARLNVSDSNGKKILVIPEEPPKKSLRAPSKILISQDQKLPVKPMAVFC